MPLHSDSTAPITVSSLTRITAPTLASLLLQTTARPKIAIIDVRDSDHIGGNINGSTWVPIHQLDARMPELLRTLKDKDKVIFHCMLSQQRGPSAALAYARAKQARDAKEAASPAHENGDQQDSAPTQDICVLEGGFGSWQARYGTDSRLTADYQADIWD